MTIFVEPPVIVFESPPTTETEPPIASEFPLRTRMLPLWPSDIPDWILIEPLAVVPSPVRTARFPLVAPIPVSILISPELADVEPPDRKRIAPPVLDEL